MLKALSILLFLNPYYSFAAECVADRFIVGNPTQKFAIELEKRRADEGNEFARSEFVVKDQKLNPYFIEAAVYDNRDVGLIFLDLKTDYSSGMSGTFNSEGTAKLGITQRKKGKQEIIEIECKE